MIGLGSDKKYISKVFLWRSFDYKYPQQGTLTLTCHDETNWECEGRPSLTCQATAARSSLLGISLQFLCLISRKYFLILTSLWLFRDLLTAKCLSTTGIGTGKWRPGTQIERINRKQIIGRWTLETITRAGLLTIHRRKTFSFNYPLKNIIFITLWTIWQPRCSMLTQSGRPPVTMTKSRLPVNQTVAFHLALNKFLIRLRMDGTVETLVLKTTTETNMRTSAGVENFLILANY